METTQQLPHAEHPTHGLVNGVDPVVSYMNAMFENYRDAGRLAWTAVKVAYSISGPLHFSTGTPSCRKIDEPGVCETCRQAARLTTMHLDREITKSVVERIQHLFGVKCDMPHPGDD